MQPNITEKCVTFCKFMNLRTCTNGYKSKLGDNVSANISCTCIC